MPDTVAREITRTDNQPPEILPPELITLEALGKQFGDAIADIKKRLGDLGVSFKRIPTITVVTGKNARGEEMKEERLDVAKDAQVAEKVTTLLAQTKAELDALETLRVAWKKPFDERSKAIQETCKALVAIVETPQATARRLLGAYQQMLQKQQAEEARKAQEAAAAEEQRQREEARKLEEQAAALAQSAETEEQRGAAAAAAEAAQQATAAADQAAGKVEAAAKADTRGHVRAGGGVMAHARTVLEITIDDPDLVPRAYCVPDMALLREAIGLGLKAIPGVSWKDVPVATVKTR